VGKRYGGIVARFPAKIIQNLWRAHNIPPTASSLIVGLAAQINSTNTYQHLADADRRHRHLDHGVHDCYYCYGADESDASHDDDGIILSTSSG
jgi:hypothetical protein